MSDIENTVNSSETETKIDETKKKELNLETKLDSLKMEDKNEKDVEGAKDNEKAKPLPLGDEKAKPLPLGEVTNNQTPDKEEDGEDCCCVCKTPSKAYKRCSKRHPKCMKKLFCSETCETLSHKKPSDKTALAMAGAKKVDKKKKVKKGDKLNGDAFWWNNSVYASW